MADRYFPIFINISGKRFLMVGAGTIATRRITGLLRFGAQVNVVAPEISDAIRALEDSFDTLSVECRSFQPGEIADYDAVLSATDQPEVDAAVYAEAKEKGIPINLASDQTKCDFYFPALVEDEDLVIGVSSSGKNHRKVRSVSAKLRELLANL